MMAVLQPLSINEQELHQLLLLSGGQPDTNSPLANLSAEHETSTPIQISDTLKKSGWLEKQTDPVQPKLTVQSMAVMQALLQPKTSVQLVLGDLQEVLITELYSDNGFRDGELVIFTERKTENGYVIRPGVSPGQVSNALLEHLMIGPRLDGLEFALTLPSQTALMFFCVLDWIYTLRLLSKVHNDRQVSFGFTPQNIWQRAMEIQMGDDLMWISALVPYIFPALQFSVSEEAVSELLDELVRLGYLDRKQEGLFYPNDFVVALADAITPMLSFGSCATHQIEDGGSGFHLAFVVGVETNLVLEAVPGADGQNWLQLTAVNGIELSKLLFRIGLSEDQEIEEIPAQEDMVPVINMVVPTVEEKSPMRKEQRFCTKCGSPLRPRIKFCPKCGHQLTERGGR